MAYYGQRTFLYKNPYSDWDEEEDEYMNAFEESSIYEEFNSQISEQISGEIVSGGINHYRGGLKPGTNGIDVTVKVSGAKGASSINVLQTIKVSNDDNVSKTDAHEDKTWISASGKELGFLDNGGFYYNKNEYNEFVDFNSSTGIGTLRLVDNGSMFNDSIEAYKKNVVHSYVVARYADNSIKVIGRMEWVFFRNSENKIVQWDKNNLTFIPGSFTETDRRIIEVSTGVKVNK